MKSGVPWSVKGIGPEAREAAKAAARHSGMTLGEWLNNIILDQSDDRPPAAGDFRSHSDAGANAIHDRLSSLAEQLERLSGRQQYTAAGRYYEGQRPPSQDRAALEAVLARIEANERHTIGAFQTVHERLESLGKQFAQSQETDNAVADSPALAALETALRNIIDHIEVNDRRTHEALHSLQNRISEAEKARATGNGTTDPDALAKLEGEVARLAERIEELRQSSQTLADDAQAAAARAARSELHEVESRIEKLLSQAQVAMRQTASVSGDLTKVRSEVEGLAQRLDDIKIEAASERDVHALQQAIEELSNRIAQGRDAKPLAEFDRRLAELARRLDQSQAQSAAMPQLQELEARLQSLDQRLAEAVRRKPDSQAMGLLERQMEGLSERLLATEQRLAGIATIERSMSQLYQSLEQTRSMAQNAAEETATRVVEHLFAQLPATTGVGASPELVALEEALGAVQREVQQSDRQTQETLQAVHDTLEQIVDKLTELEAAQGDRMQAPHQATLEEPVSQEQVRTPQPSSHPTGWRRAGEPHQQAAAEPIEQVLRAASESSPAIPEETHPPDALAAAQSAPIDDYIAAARRAAQDAVGSRAGARSHAGEVTSTSNGPLRFFPFPAAKRTRMMNGAAVPVEVQGSMRKRLILGALLLLAAVSAYALKGVYQRLDEPATSAVTVPAESAIGRASGETRAAPPKAMSPQSWLNGPEDGQVARAQSLLLRLGFDVGKLDGRMNLKTANAIRLFQLQNGMAVNGEVGAELLTRLELRLG